MKKVLIISFCILLISCITFVGCSDPEPTTSETEPTTGQVEPTTSETTTPETTTPEPTTSISGESQPKSGGVLKRGFPELGITDWGYPVTATPDSTQANTFCVQGLVGYDDNMNLVPKLSTDWDISEDGKIITIFLREGVTFHDGSDFNAEVAKWNMDNFRLSEKAGLKSVESIDIVDEYTIQLNISEYDNLIITNLADQAGLMISKVAFETNGQEWAEKNPVGAGPMKFVSQEKDVNVVFERFDDYWGGKPYLDGVEVIAFADETTALMAFLKGELDVLHARNAKDARDLGDQGYDVGASSVGPHPFLAGDSIHPDSPFANILVRQAISYAINVPDICEGLGFGYWTTNDQWALPGTPFHNNDVVGYPYDPDKAIALLEQAGYGDGFDCTIYYLNMEQSTSCMTSVQSFLQNVGIRATLEPHTIDKFLMTANSGLGWENGLYQVYSKSSVDNIFEMSTVIPADQATLSWASFLRPAACQELFDEALHATDIETKYALGRDLNKMIVDEYCMVTWLWVQPTFEINQSWTHSDWGTGDYNHFDAEEAWLDK